MISAGAAALGPSPVSDIRAQLAREETLEALAKAHVC